VSRGLETLELRGPTCTIYRNPHECVLLDPQRDANPFFHFFESMWVLAGSNRLAFPRFFLNRYAEYSDDGQTLHGAYGYRLRNWNPCEKDPQGFDQLDQVINLLADKPDTRQAVLSIWNPSLDLYVNTKDMPCNDMVMLKVRDNRLDMTVCCRSNDAIWGAYGANAVQFSFLQQFIAAHLGVEVGYYVQMSDSLHVYTALPLWQDYVAGRWQPDPVVNPYGPTWEQSEPTNMFADGADADAAVEDARALIEMAERGLLAHAAMWPSPKWKSSLGRDVMRPMLCAYVNYKNGAFTAAHMNAGNIKKTDWRTACTAWIERRGDQ
jgi:hypothetical protein